MPGTPDDEEVDLGIGLGTVATIVDQARALQAKDDAGADPGAEDEAGDAALPGDMAEDMPGGMTEETLRALIADLDEDQRASLVALAWIGRGDHGPEEWEEARALAAERGAGRDPADELLAMDDLGDLLAEGVAAFGVSIEEVER
jgi:hypothetical protein